jgi:hypothetical protein
VTYEAQRLMDDLVDLELEAVERILVKVDNDPEPDDVKRVERETWQLLGETGRKGRRTGLGFTGLADALGRHEPGLRQRGRRGGHPHHAHQVRGRIQQQHRHGH